MSASRLQLQQQALREASQRIAAHATKQTVQRVRSLGALERKVEVTKAATPAPARIQVDHFAEHAEIHDDDETKPGAA